MDINLTERQPVTPEISFSEENSRQLWAQAGNLANLEIKFWVIRRPDLCLRISVVVWLESQLVWMLSRARKLQTEIENLP